MPALRGAWCVVRDIAVVVTCLAACREVPAPEGGVHAISRLIVPAPGLVAGDTLRDSLGVAAPLDVIAFGLDNKPLDPQPEHSFVVLDTGAHLDAATGRFLVGEDPGTSVRVVGTVGSLQTQPVTVKVTLAPDTIVPADTIVHHVRYTIPPAITAQTTLNVNVRNRAEDAGVEAVIVHFTVDQAPPSVDGTPTVVLLNGSVVSTRDTTESSGRASRVAQLRLAVMAAPALDTALVRATTAYRGASLGTVQFIIVFQREAPGALRSDH